MGVGKVYLVGAGPGEPGLITLRAAECLRRADIVLYDYLANPAILGHCRSGAELISLGKHGRQRIWTQEEINRKMVEQARSGKAVVRLKSGDPTVFARSAEELGCLVEHGIEFEIVPGVTAALAAGSYAGIPLTHRESASAVALVTGRESESSAHISDAALDYAALGQFPGTLVFYMGVTTAGEWSQALIGAGKNPATPVAILRRLSLPDQQRIDTTLASVAAVVQERKLRPPAVFVVGDVATLGKEFTWFDKRPLFGHKVLVTRALHQANDLIDDLGELGADVLSQPAIEIRAPDDWSTVDAAIARLHAFNWLVFSSANGVRYMLERLLSTQRDIRALGNVKLAAIGPGTAEELARYHLKADLIPDEYRAESLAAALASSAAGKRFLLARASRGREVLAEELKKVGGIVEQIVVYESVDIPEAEPEIVEKMAAGQITWTTVTSSAIARSLANMFGSSLTKTKLASISPITSATLRELRYEPAAEAKEFTMAGVVAAIRETLPR